MEEEGTWNEWKKKKNTRVPLDPMTELEIPVL